MMSVERGMTMAKARIGLVGHFARKDIRGVAASIAQLLREHDADVITITTDAQALPGVPAVSATSLCEHIDVLIAVGGDGTILQAAGLVVDSRIPILGVNKGHLGFLSEIEVEEFEDALPSILDGNYLIDERMMIQGRFVDRSGVQHRMIALNDLVINRNLLDNMLECEADMEGQLIDYYAGDGIIVATPTGSTGYSLSADGPLIYPGTDCLIVNPICPHVLGTAAVIVPADREIRIKITRSREPASVFADGRLEGTMQIGDVLSIRRAPESIRLVHLREHPFFDAVRNKLLNRNYRMTNNRSQVDEE